MSWAKIIVITLLTTLAAGLTFGIVTTVLGVSLPGGTAGIGAAGGVVGGLLVARRLAAQGASKKP